MSPFYFIIAKTSVTEEETYFMWYDACWNGTLAVKYEYKSSLLYVTIQL